MMSCTAENAANVEMKTVSCNAKTYSPFHNFLSCIGPSMLWIENDMNNEMD